MKTINPNLFYSLPTNTSIISSNYTNISLQKISGDETSFEINVPGTDEYTDLSDIYLKLEVSIEKNNLILKKEIALILYFILIIK